MPWLTQLADVARRTGHPVTEVGGWRTRGHGPQPAVRGVVAHHTAGASAGGDYPALGVVRDGRAGLAGPLSQLGIGRSGRIYVIAAGRCWHNAPSTSNDHTNSNSIGIEAENDGSQPWPAAQLDAYKKLCAALCNEFGLPASRVKGHKEVNTQKPDPHSIDMNAFRADVARVMSGGQLEDEVPKHVAYRGSGLDLVVRPGQWRYVPFTHKNGVRLDSLDYSVVFGAAQFIASCGIRFANAEGEGYAPLERGTEVQMRAVEVTSATGGGFDVIEQGPIDSPMHASGGGHFTHTWNGNAQAGHRVRFHITQFGDHPVLLDHSQASVHTWDY